VGTAGERAGRVPAPALDLSIVVRILALVTDLMLASRVEAPLTAAGYEVTVRGEPGADVGAFDAIVDDLELVEPEAVAAAGPPCLGFYSHVDVETRRRAEAAGIDLVVPRSRMARELPDLVAGLVPPTT
jgi:hypothetical protein